MGKIKLKHFLKGGGWVLVIISFLIPVLTFGNQMGFNATRCGHIFFSILAWLTLFLFSLIIPLGLIILINPETGKHDFFSKNDLFLKYCKTVIFSFLVAILALIYNERKYGERSVITIALTDFSPSPKSDLTKFYNAKYIETANKALGDYQEMFALHVEKVGKPYTNVIDAVANDRVSMAVVSPLTWFVWQTQYNSIKPEKGEKAENVFSEIKMVGFKYPSEGHTYTSGFIYWRGNEPMEDFIEQLQKGEAFPNIPYGTFPSLLLSNEKLSTSGRFIPSLFLINHNLPCIVQEAKYIRPDEIPTLIEENTDYFGAFSSDQWDIFKKANPKKWHHFAFMPIDKYPIPFDAMIVREDIWKDKFDRPFQLYIDFITMRKINLRQTRSDIICNAMKIIMGNPFNDHFHNEQQTEKDKSIVNGYCPDNFRRTKDIFELDLSKTWMDYNDEFFELTKMGIPATPSKRRIFLWKHLEPTLKHSTSIDILDSLQLESIKVTTPLWWTFEYKGKLFDSLSSTLMLEDSTFNKDWVEYR